MNKEIKIGLSVIFALLVVFGAVLVYKLRGPAEEPSLAINTEAGGENGQLVKPILASGPGGPTVLAANEKPERTPHGSLHAGDSHAADNSPPPSDDRYSRYDRPPKAAARTENGEENRPSFLPKAPPDASETGKTGEAGNAIVDRGDRYGTKGRYPREHLTADENAPVEPPSHVATAGNQQPSEAAADSPAADGPNPDGPNATVDPFNRRSTGPRAAEQASNREGLLPADNVQLTSSPRVSAAGDGQTGNGAAGEINTTAGPGETPPEQFGNDVGKRDGARGAEQYAPPIYSRAAKGGATSPHPADEPPGAGMPYRLAESPDARQRPRGSSIPPEATGSERPLQQGETYTVEPNDSFWTISEKVYGTGGYFKAIQRHNQPKTGRTAGLNVGQSLSVPAVEVLAQKYPDLCPKPRGRPTDRGQMMTAAAGARDRLAGGGRMYVVERGDTLFDIARYELGKASRWKEIHDLNVDQLGHDFDHLSPGMKLILPDGGQSETITSKPQNPIQR